MANRSVFPNQIDTFVEHYDIQANDVANVRRWQELRLKTTLTPSEQTELQNLTTTLRNKMFTPEDFNKLQDSITNLETFFRDNVQGFVATKQTEMESFVTTKKNEVNAYVDTKKTEMNNFSTLKQTEMETSKTNAISVLDTKKTEYTTYVDTQKTAIQANVTDGIAQMESKKNYFSTFVDTKEDEVRSLVQEFDSNTARYYTAWTATAGQVDFNIFNGSNVGIPPEANLNIPEENIDLVINGVLQKPYTDYVIHNNGFYNIIRLVGNAQTLIQAGTEVVGKWYKNVGKLYFKHATSHGAGSTDPITVAETMCDSALKAKVNMVNKKITVGNVAPSSPALNEVWIDTN